MQGRVCDLVLPCRDEGPALEVLLPRVSEAYRVIVVDNGSRDDTADVARSHGATVVSESRAGYGAAVHAGLEAATAEYVAFMDGDGSFDPDELGPLLDDVREGRADLAVGRRCPARSGVWPWHARAGNALVVAWLRHRIGMPAHDIAPMRVSPSPCPARPGHPGPRVRLPGRAAAASSGRGVAVRRARRHLPPARRGHPLQGLRLGDRHAADRPRLRASPAMSASRSARLLVVAKSPVPGLAKTRLGAEVGMDVAAELAAAALLDTLGTCVATVGVDRCRLALEGDLAQATYADRLAAALDGWAVFPQRGDGLAERLACSHLDLAAEEQGPVVQICMDTPQVTEADLTDGDRRASTTTTPCWPTPRTVAGGRWRWPTRGRASTWSAYRCPRRPRGPPRGRRSRAPASRSAAAACCATSTSPTDADAVAEACAEDSVFAALWRRVRD